MRYVLLALFAFSFLGNSFAQQYPIRTISFNEGLPSAQVSDIVQDHNGVIWMATFAGLVKYDGVNLSVINGKQGLINNTIYDLFIDSDSTLWLTTEGGGVQYLDGDSLKYPLWMNNTLGYYGINNIEESEDGRLWFSTYANGVIILENGEFSQLSTEDGLGSNTVWHSWFDDNGHVWFSTNGGISVYDGKKIANYDSTDGLSSSITYRVVEDQKGTLWIPTFKGLSKYENGAFQTVENFSGDDVGSIYDVIADKKGRIWVGTANYGVYVIDDDEIHLIDEDHGLSSNFTFRIYEDNHGSIWVATDENGISVLDDINARYFSSESELAQNTVLCVHKKGGVLWLGTSKGLHYKKSEKFGRTKLKALIGDANERDVDIWDIEQLTNGNLLIQANDSELYEFNGISGLTDFGKKVGFLEEIYFNDTYVDSKGRVWVATQSGLYRVDSGRQQKVFEMDSLESDFIWTLFEDSNNRMWFGTDTGFQFFEGDSLINLRLELGIRQLMVTQITEDKAGNIWIGTDQGICVLMRSIDGWTYHHFQMDDYFLKDSMILHIDKFGNLWQGTNGGIHQYFISDYKGERALKSRYFALDEYGEGIEINHRAIFEEEDGTLLIGTTGHGLLEISPRSEEDFAASEKPVIVSATANLNPFFKNNTYLSREMRSDENNINISFSALSYTDPNEVFYSYRLAGFDDDWKLVQNQHQVSYTNLPAGKYSFELMSKSGSNDWSKEASVLSFSISKPFFKQLWFIMLSISVLGLFTMGYLNNRLDRIEKRKLKRLVDEQTKELSDALGEKEVLIKEIHHRVKNNLAVISGLLELKIMSEVDEKAKSDLIESQLRIKTMASIHEKLYKSDSLASIDIKHYVEDLVRVISHSLKREDLEVEINLHVDDVEITVHQALPTALVLNEIIANSFEHAFKGRQKGKLSVQLREDGDNLILSVKDDGIGIPQEYLDKTRDSLGITLIRTFVSQLNGLIEYNINEGTEIYISFAKELYPAD